MNTENCCAVLISELDKKQRNHPLGRRLVTIGSSPESHIRLECEGVEENHSYILFKSGAYHLRNIGSDGSIVVNGKPVQDTIALPGRCTIRIGGAVLEYVPVDTESSAGNSVHGDSAQPKGLFEHTIEAVRAILEGQDFESCATRLVHITAEMMKCDGVRLLTLEEGNEIRTVASVPADAPGHRFSQTALRLCDTADQSVLIGDPGTTPELPCEESMLLKEIRSVLCAPLDSRDNLRIGYLYLDRIKSAEPFSEEDRGIFEKLRTLFSGLLDNAIQKERQSRTITALQENTTLVNNGGMIFQSRRMSELVERGSTAAMCDAAEKVLWRSTGNISLAARMLDMDRKVFTRLLEKLRIDAGSFKCAR